MNSMPDVSTSAGFMHNLNKRISVEKEASSVVKTSRSFTGYTPLMASLSAVVVIAVVMLGIEFIPMGSSQATLTPTMADQQLNDIPGIPSQTQDNMLAESEDDSTEYDGDIPVKSNFNDRIQLVGDKRP
jgi:hypothetical protein